MANLVGDATNCLQGWQAGNAGVVFDDNKVWATCWNGRRGGMANLVGDATNCPPGWPAGDAWVVFGARRCGLCVGMEVEVAWPFSR